MHRLFRALQEAVARGDAATAKRLDDQIEALHQTRKRFDERIEAAREADNPPLEERLLKEKLAFVRGAFGNDDGNTRDTLEALATFYEGQAREPEAIGVREELIERAGRSKAGWERMQARFALASTLEDDERWKEAEPHLRAAYEDVADDPAHREHAAARLGRNLAQQKRYREAEPFLVEGDDLADSEMLASTLEGLGRWREAESHWREVGDKERLAANLRGQGRTAEAADVAAESYAALEAETAARGPVTPEQVRQNGARASANAVPYLRARAVELDAQGRRDEAKEMRRLAQLFEEEARNPTPWVLGDSVDTGLASERARLARLQLEAGRFDRAAEGLRTACPQLRDRSAFDLKPGFRVGEVPVRPGECFTNLTMALAAQKSPAMSIDPETFAAAQLAAETDAGIALNRAGARNFVASKGGGSILDEIDRHARAQEAIFERVFGGRPLDPSGLPVNFTMADSNQYFGAMRPHQFALEKLMGELRARVPEYMDLRAPAPVALGSLRSRTGEDSKLLNADEALVLWVVPPGSERGFVFAVSKERSGWARISLDGATINKLVGQLRAQIDPCAYDQQRRDCVASPQDFNRAAAWTLYEALLGAPEIQAVISPEAISTLLIVPSGPLTALPPALLITEAPVGGADGDRSPKMLKTAAWLIRQKALAILPGVSTLRTLRAPPAAGLRPEPDRTADRLFMMADPDFAGTGSAAAQCLAAPRGAGPVSIVEGNAEGRRRALARLPRLPCTRLEGKALQKMLGGELLLDRDARESRLRTPAAKARLGGAEVIGFATHGLVAGDFDVTEPALALAAPLPSEAADDGLLTASEIASLRMSAQWVLLSACNTASPDSKGAQGLSGLSRAFFNAGASAVLASHWRVDDVAAQALVTKAIELRIAGVGKAEAVRQASLAVMNGSVGPQDDSAAHPSAWAAFTLIGEPS